MSQICKLIILLGMSQIVAENAIRSARQEFLNSTKVLEIFWESYLTFPHTLDSCLIKKNLRSRRQTEPAISKEVPFGFRLSDLPLPESNGNKRLVINIAFANANLDECERRFVCREFICGLHLFEEFDQEVFEQLKNDIEVLRSKGIIVKLAFGGEEYGNTRLDIKTTHVADTITDIMIDSVLELGVDGIDLVQNEGCGSSNLACQDQSSIHLYMIERLRRELPEKIISYTFPTGNYELNFPFIDVVKYGQKHLDAINFFGTSFNYLEEHLPVDPKKVIMGFPIGCNQDPFRNVTLEIASDVANIAKSIQAKGISMWSINKDTNRRHGQGCNEFQTGQDDGTFLNTLYELL